MPKISTVNTRARASAMGNNTAKTRVIDGVLNHWVGGEWVPSGGDASLLSTTNSVVSPELVLKTDENGDVTLAGVIVGSGEVEDEENLYSLEVTENAKFYDEMYALGGLTLRDDDGESELVTKIKMINGRPVLVGYLRGEFYE